ncbi:SPFH domain-containing protein [Corynebacterium guaraldiae]|uniref:SPFH domain-containing protein n=2 Tax=Corynebacterium TaxID=1716 RepID=A0ABT0T9B8_9CORY|nr:MULTISPECIES: SPFH domain-containing protein [Corynebacterium]MCL8493676.1 SPFH domain-containing protein [Corynebacterium intestinale]MCP1389910.1 SPFH domain-containing protein [Corynebacterium intestinale]TRX48176.1 SPFH domain-containing protein [Corynebacterium guaraldiae]TRX50253.1 SPFH domain-containing protein [Corynebacterium guaraldiae]
MGGLIVIGVILLIIIATAFDGFYIVRTKEAAIIERMGKFVNVAHAGLHFKVPYVDRVRAKISLQIRQLDVMVETKTKDNVFVQIPVAVQYEVVQGSERQAFYTLSNHEQQIVAYVQDNVRSSVANMDLDDSFSSKDTIARNVAMSLRDNMAAYGWNFVNTLVTDIRPDARVRESMNSINAAQREREAAVAQAEAEKIRVVKEAEGAAEAKKLQGRGVADQRKEIVEGIAQQYELLRAAGVQENPETLMLVSQYLDAMVDVADRAHTNVLYMPSNPGGMQDLFGGMRDALLSTNAINEAPKPSVSLSDNKHSREDSGAARRRREEQERHERDERARRDAEMMEQAQRAQQQAQQQVQNAPQQGQGFSQIPSFPSPPQGNNQPQSARDYFDQLRNQLNKGNN